MAVPELPFLVSAANQEFQKQNSGLLSVTGALAKINRAFYASELAGTAIELPVTANAFDVSGYTPGVHRGGGGPRGIPGTVAGKYRTGYMPMVTSYRSDSYSGNHHCSRDLAFFGQGIKEQHLLNAGLNVSQCIGTTRTLQFISNVYADDELRIGYLQFHKDSPWSCTWHQLFFHDYDHSGREWSRVTRTAGTPPPNYIWVPAYWNNTGAEKYTMRVRTI